MLAMDGFGASAPAERLFQEFKFTAERAAEMVRRLLARRHAPGGSEGS
jgi:transketolase